MSESDSSIPQKLADLAEALRAVHQSLGVGSGLYRPFNGWFRDNGPDAKPQDRDSRDRLRSCVKAASEFVKEVDTANRTLNAIPVSVLEPLSKLLGGMPWDVQTRRTLRAIQHEAAFLKSISMEPSMLDSLLNSMGKDGFKQQQSNLLGLRAELTERLMDLDSLPDDLSHPTDTTIGQRSVHRATAPKSNGSTESDVGSVVPSSKRQDPTEPVDSFGVARAREQLRPYVEIPAFQEYLKGQILKWELWHRSHTEEINEYEGLRDKSHQELKELQGRGLRQSDDPAEFDPLGHAEICYENYRDIAAGLRDDPEYKLVADREPVLYKEASIATIVALFWCDINDSTFLVPEYDFLEPEGSFIEHVRKQWRDPIDGRYIHIDWMVQAAVDAYERKRPVAPQAEKSIDTADKMQESMVPAEPSHPVPERTTRQQPSGSVDADTEAKLTPTVGDEAVEPETTESTTTQQKKPVIESKQNKKTESKDDPHRTAQKPQSETVQLTEELKVVAFLTNGVSSEVVKKVASIVRSSKSLEDKLHQVDQIIKIPAQNSRRLGKMFSVSHTAIQRTGWWKKNHKSKEDQFAEREARLKERGKRSGLLPDDDE